jgi:HPt (histidine-containing phosphotransfer) domain-containing protein
MEHRKPAGRTERQKGYFAPGGGLATAGSGFFNRSVCGMKKILEALRAQGCDVDGALSRMLGDADFMLVCVRMALDDADFGKLGEDLEKGDAGQAFERAHTLKGVMANTGLVPLYNSLVKIVEPLRAGHAENLGGEYARLMRLRDEMRDIAGKSGEGR